MQVYDGLDVLHSMLMKKDINPAHAASVAKSWCLLNQERRTLIGKPAKFVLGTRSRPAKPAPRKPKSTTDASLPEFSLGPEAKEDVGLHG